jgi:hypothetical protein
MDFKKYLPYVLALVLLVVLIYLASPLLKPTPQVKDKTAELLYMRALETGKGKTTYLYSYNESMNGFPLKTTLTVYGGNKFMKQEDLFSTKEIFWIGNDSYVCVTYGNHYACAYANNDSSLKSYVKQLDAAFFDSYRISNDVGDKQLLLDRNALLFDKVQNSEVNGKPCSLITYHMDFSNLTFDDLNKLGVTQMNTNRIDGTICINNETGEPLEKTFWFSQYNRNLSVRWTLLQSDWNYATPINFTGNASKEWTNSVIGLLSGASSADSDLLSCLGKDGLEKDKCLFTMAIQNGYEQLCPLAGSKISICQQNFAAVAKDQKKCVVIADASVKDDCYVELAATLKNATLCDSVVDVAKKTQCGELVANATVVLPPVQMPAYNESLVTGNVTVPEGLQK